MIGLIALSVIFVWLATAIWLARAISRRIQTKRPMRAIAAAVLAVIIFLLPVADELAARPYFNTLCHKGAVLKVNPHDIRGRRATVSANPSNAMLSGTAIPILRSHFIYRDATSGEVLVEYDTYEALGGLLSRAIPLFRGHPVTGSYFCAPERDPPIAEQFKLVVVD